VGSDGPLTDPLLRADDVAMVLVPAHDPRGFVEAVLALARDADQRARGGQAARALYDRCFAWQVIARSIVTVLEAHGQALAHD